MRKLPETGSHEKGQVLIEYAFVLLLIFIVVIFMISGIGKETSNSYSTFNSAFSNAAK